MPAFPVTVTASYDAIQAPRGTRRLLEVWASSGDGRTFVVDDSIGPVRWTMTADYLVDAPSQHAAESSALDRFSTETSRASIVTPETVVAASGPLG